MTATVETRRERCASDGFYWHEAVDADGQRVYGPSTVGDTAKCRNCGLPLMADIRYSGSASIGDFGGVRYSDETQERDPLAELAAAIGAKLPFSVLGASAGDNGRDTILRGSFSGGTPITLTVSASSDLRWYSNDDTD